jgi:nucleoside-diphosphate-sugar epimerase
MGEQLCRLFTRLYGMPTVSLRYADAYGAGQPARGPYAVVIAELVAQHGAGRPPCFAGNRSQEFDFVHVSDVVEATICAHRSSASGVTLNVGSGRTHSIKTVADHFASLESDERVSPLVGSHRPASIAETEARTGWSPKISLAEGLKALLAGEGGACRPVGVPG